MRNDSMSRFWSRMAVGMLVTALLMGCANGRRAMSLYSVLYQPKVDDKIAEVRGLAAVDSLSGFGSLSYYASNGWGRVSPSYQYYQNMKQSLDVETLDSLARHHESAVVRATAGRILIELGSELAMPLIADRLSDSSLFTLFFWDMGHRSNVADFLVAVPHMEHLLSLEDSLILDSLILHTPGLGHISYRARLVDSLPLLPEYYPIIRRIYIEEKDPSVLVKLAAYREEQDTALILKALSTFRGGGRSEEWAMALKAVGGWPHESFRDSILAVREFLAAPDEGLYMGSTRYLFSAIMAYRDVWALRCIEECFEMIAQHNNNEPESLYDGVGMWTHWWGECFDRAYQLNPDPYFFQLHKEHAFPSDMGW